MSISNRKQTIKARLAEYMHGAQTMTVTNLCNYFGLDRKTVIRDLRDVPHHRFGTKRLYDIDDLARYYAQTESTEP